MQTHSKIGIVGAVLLIPALVGLFAPIPHPLVVACCLSGFLLLVVATGLQLDWQTTPEQTSRRLAAEAERAAVRASQRRYRS